MSKWWFIVLATFFAWVGLGTAILTVDDDDDGPNVEAVLNLDILPQSNPAATCPPKPQWHKLPVDSEPSATLLRPLKAFSSHLLIPASALLAQIGLPPRAPALA